MPTLMTNHGKPPLHEVAAKLPPNVSINLRLPEPLLADYARKAQRLTRESGQTVSLQMAIRLALEAARDSL